MRIYWDNTFYHPLLMMYTSLYTVTCPETEEPAECPPEGEEEDALCQGEGAIGSDAGCPPDLMCCNSGCNVLDCMGKWKKLTGKEFFSFQDHFSNAEILINPPFLREHFCFNCSHSFPDSCSSLLLTNKGWDLFLQGFSWTVWVNVAIHNANFVALAWS